MKTTEQQDLEVQLLKKQIQFYEIANFNLACFTIGMILYGIYRAVINLAG